MPIIIKVIFTLLAILIMFAVALVSSKEKSDGPDRIWKGGKLDTIRWLIFRHDGSLRNAFKPVMILFFIISIALIWLVIPS
jgi:hypothetical protein